MLTVLTDDIGPTATYARRSFAWVSDGSGEVVIEATGEVLPGLGKLTIKVQKAARAGSACEVDSYVVQAADPTPEGWPVYLLLNVTDRTQPQPYRVTLSPRPTCTCKGGQCKAPSDKHTDSVGRLHESGVLFAPEPPAALPDEPEWATAGTANTDWLEAA